MSAFSTLHCSCAQFNIHCMITADSLVLICQHSPPETLTSQLYKYKFDRLRSCFSMKWIFGTHLQAGCVTFKRFGVRGYAAQDRSYGEDLREVWLQGSMNCYKSVGEDVAKKKTMFTKCMHPLNSNQSLYQIQETTISTTNNLWYHNEENTETSVICSWNRFTFSQFLAQSILFCLRHEYLNIEPISSNVKNI